jgi:hypothetical protein
VVTLDSMLKHERVERFAGASDKTLTYAVFVCARCFTYGQEAIFSARSRRNDLGT